jgi:hypothetical protein
MSEPIKELEDMKNAVKLVNEIYGRYGDRLYNVLPVLGAVYYRGMLKTRGRDDAERWLQTLNSVVRMLGSD